MKSIKSIKSILLFPLFPFLVFVYSICNLRNICNQIIFVCFFCIFGYCHTFTDIRADSYRKYVYFNNFNRYDVTEIYDALTSGEIKDVYEQLLFNWVKGFTDNPHIMMMIVGLVGGFLYLLVIKRFLHDNHRGLTFPVFILLIVQIAVGICFYFGIAWLLKLEALTYVVDTLKGYVGKKI